MRTRTPSTPTLAEGLEMANSKDAVDQAISYSGRWNEIIHHKTLSEAQGKEIIEESKVNFARYFNRGWLDYRKSVTEAGDWAATEWTGSGALFRDVLGREYIDCLRGYGLLDLGWARSSSPTGSPNTSRTGCCGAA